MDNESVNESRDPQPLEWTDDECIKIASKDFFPSQVKDMLVQKRVITRFLDFYLGGRRSKGLGVDDLVFAVLAIIPHSPYNETIVWANQQFRDDGSLFFLSPEEKLAGDIKQIVENTKEQQEDYREDEHTLEEIEDTLPIENNEADNFDFLDDALGSNNLSKILQLLQEKNNNNNMIQDDVSSDSGEADVDQSTPMSTFPQDIKFDPKTKAQENRLINYGPLENAAFITFCDTTLDKWETDSQARTVLKSFFVVVALVLMRATAKGYKHLVTTFHSERFLRFLQKMQELAPTMQYSPPHKRCLKGAFRTFCRKDKNTPIMFAKLICLSSAIKDRYLKYILSNCLLNYTSDYGLNLVLLWQRIHTAVEDIDDVKRIVELTTFDDTRDSWRRLSEFLRKYKSSASRNSAYRWARILHSGYFRELSCQANYALAVVLAVFAERLAGNTGVWSATWVRNDDEEERLKTNAGQLYEQYVSQKL